MPDMSSASSPRVTVLRQATGAARAKAPRPARTGHGGGPTPAASAPRASPLRLRETKRKRRNQPQPALPARPPPAPARPRGPGGPGRHGGAGVARAAGVGGRALHVVWRRGGLRLGRRCVCVCVLTTVPVPSPLLRRDVSPCLNSVVLRCNLSLSLSLYTVTGHLLWYLPENVLAAPASALCGWKGVHSSLSLSLLSLLVSLVYLEVQSRPWSTCLLTYLSLSLFC